MTMISFSKINMQYRTLGRPDSFLSHHVPESNLVLLCGGKYGSKLDKGENLSEVKN